MNRGVVSLQAVVEVSAIDARVVSWPMSSRTPGSWMVLDAGCGDEQVGLFVAVLAGRIDVPATAVMGEVVDVLLAEEFLITAGGLRVRDEDTGTAVVPGCCAGLEGWRDWLEVCAGASPWLGHDPDPEVEAVGDLLRVWQNGGPNRHHGPWAGIHVDLRRAALPHLLREVRQDLVDFLAAIASWAGRGGLGRRGDALVEAVDHSFSISAPLTPPCD